MAKKNIKLTICYDGSAYHGWQVQPKLATIQQMVNFALENLFGHSVKVRGASRTDAGVHAMGQTANIFIDTPIPPERLVKALTQRLPNDIAILEAVEVPLDFDASLCPVDKHYRYTIYTAKQRPVFSYKHCWHYPYIMDAELMNTAAQRLVGTKDFKSFASSDDHRENTVRTIYKCSVVRDVDKIYVDVVGNRFLYNMVRNIVGTLVEVGRKRWEPEHIDKIVEAKDRREAGQLAPGSGLCLMHINYGDSDKMNREVIQEQE